MGHDVSLVGDGTHALHMARVADPHVVLLDRTLSAIDRYQIARLLRQELGASARIAAVCGPAMEDTEQPLQAEPWSEPGLHPHRPP